LAHLTPTTFTDSTLGGSRRPSRSHHRIAHEHESGAANAGTFAVFFVDQTIKVTTVKATQLNEVRVGVK
jgi:hypothetical protein